MSGFVYPNGTKTAPRLTGNFGPRQSFWTPGGWTSNYHYGTDMVGFSTVCSPVDGIVVAASYSGGFGNLVKVREANGDEWWHAHLAPNSFRVRVGDRVSAGQPLATMGTTGRSTGVHLHWEYHPKGGSARDAMPEARARIVALASVGSKPLPTPVEEEEEPDMARNSGIYYERKNPANGKVTIVYNVHNTVSGFEHEFSNGEGGGALPGSYVNPLAQAFDTPSWAKVTEGHARVIKAALAAVRPKDAPRSIEVEIIDPDDVPA